MNIVEAAEHVKNGLLVRRACWESQNYMGMDHCGLYIALHENGMNLQRHFSIQVEELLALDWLLYTPQNTSVRPSGLSLRKK